MNENLGTTAVSGDLSHQKQRGANSYAVTRGDGAEWEERDRRNYPSVCKMFVWQAPSSVSSRQSEKYPWGQNIHTWL